MAYLKKYDFDKYVKLTVDMGELTIDGKPQTSGYFLADEYHVVWFLFDVQDRYISFEYMQNGLRWNDGDYNVEIYPDGRMVGKGSSTEKQKIKEAFKMFEDMIINCKLELLTYAD